LFTASYTGFVLGETPAVLGGALVFNTTATTASPTGNYPIVPSGLTSTNYAITFVNGTLNIFQPAAQLDAMFGALYAEMTRFGLVDFDNELVECLGAGAGSNGGPPRGVASSAPRKCRNAASGVTIDTPAAKVAPGASR
jgi:hypothetical protein